MCCAVTRDAAGLCSVCFQWALLLSPWSCSSILNKTLLRHHWCCSAEHSQDSGTPGEVPASFSDSKERCLRCFTTESSERKLFLIFFFPLPDAQWAKLGQSLINNNYPHPPPPNKIIIKPPPKQKTQTKPKKHNKKGKIWFSFLFLSMALFLNMLHIAKHVFSEKMVFFR